MQTISMWCEKNKIKLTPAQQQSLLKFQVKEVYSSYPKPDGRVFFCSTTSGDHFITLFSKGGVHTEYLFTPDLHRLPITIGYYAKQGGPAHSPRG